MKQKDIKKPKDNKKPSIPGVFTGVDSSISTILSLMSLMKLFLSL